LARVVFARVLQKLSQLPDGKESALYLFSHVLGGDSVSVAKEAVRRNHSLTPQQLTHLESLVHRRGVLREPLQFIVGHWDFYGVKNFIVQAPTLCPRPETEELADLAMRAAEKKGVCGHLLDVGSGSGVLAASILARLKGWNGIALDISQKALELTARNAAVAGVERNLSFELGDMRSWAPPSGTPPFDVIVSNPPYIPEEEMISLAPEVIEWEDPRALLGGSPGGMGLILSLLGRAPPWLVPGGHLLLEVSHGHPSTLYPLLCPSLGTPPAETIHLLPASGLGLGRTISCTPLCEEDVEMAKAACAQGGGCTLAQLPDVWAWEGGYLDSFGQPRFIHLVRRG